MSKKIPTRKLSDYEVLHNIMEDIRRAHKEINIRKVRMCYLLSMLKEQWTSSMEQGYGSFNYFLAELGTSITIEEPMIRIGKYLRKQGVDVEQVEDIPWTKLNLASIRDFELDDEMISNLRELSYTALKSL